jgi:hypothetical protein
MYFGDHNPPHFHAIYQDSTAEYDINTLNIIRGQLPARAHVLVVEWAFIHRVVGRLEISIRNERDKKNRATNLIVSK